MPATNLSSEVILAISTLVIGMISAVVAVFTAQNTRAVKSMQDIIDLQARQMKELQDEYSEIKAENMAMKTELEELRAENIELRRQLANTKPRGQTRGW